MIATIPSLSLEYIRVSVTATGIDAGLVTSLPVEMAFIQGEKNEPVEGDWYPAEWDSNSDYPTARCLVGPPYAPLTDGVYWVWIRVTGSEERPVRQAGKLRIT